MARQRLEATLEQVYDVLTARSLCMSQPEIAKLLGIKSLLVGRILRNAEGWGRTKEEAERFNAYARERSRGLVR